jgi:two-component system nitrate/nitrite sensor histidine kinase NarX
MLLHLAPVTAPVPRVRSDTLARVRWWHSRWCGAAVVVTALALAHLLRLANQRSRKRAVHEERARLARDLHDGIAQKLTAIGLLVDRERNQPRDRQSQVTLGRVRDLVKDAHGDLRRALWDMRDDLGADRRLESLIERVLGQVEAPSSTVIRLITTGEPLRVDALCAHETPRIVREALTNAVRHSGATRIEVGLLSDENALHVWIKDDGRGFAPEEALQGGGGQGLLGMSERARRLGGTLRLCSRPGRGTEVSLYIKRVSATNSGR